MSLYDKPIDRLTKLIRSGTLILAVLSFIFICVGVNQVFITNRNIDAKTNEIQKSLRCISQFFTQTNRANLKVDDIQKCTIVRQ